MVSFRFTHGFFTGSPWLIGSPWLPSGFPMGVPMDELDKLDNLGLYLLYHILFTM